MMMMTGMSTATTLRTHGPMPANPVSATSGGKATKNSPGHLPTNQPGVIGVDFFLRRTGKEVPAELLFSPTPKPVTRLTIYGTGATLYIPVPVGLESGFFKTLPPAQIAEALWKPLLKSNNTNPFLALLEQVQLTLTGSHGSPLMPLHPRSDVFQTLPKHFLSQLGPLVYRLK
jgi:hypothetical protein